MNRYEKQFWEWVVRHRLKFLAAAATLFSLYARYALRGLISADMRDCLFPWYDAIRSGGGFQSLSAQVGDYNIPNLTMEKEKIPTGKYARMRLRYLKEYNKPLYSILWMDKKLAEHLKEIQETASMRVNKIVEQMAKEENITENLKAQDQMKWVQLMNNLRITAEEIVAT